MSAVRQGSLDESGPLSPASRIRLRDPILWVSVQARIALALGIVFLMSVKPGLIGSLTTIGVSLIAGLVASTPIWGRGSESDPAIAAATSLDEARLARERS